MQITQQATGSTIILNLKGRVDTFSSKELDRAISKILKNENHQILIDFSEVDFIASSGLRVLLTAVKYINQVKGKLALCTLKPKVREIFDLVGFSNLFPIFSNREEALKELSSGN